MFLIVIIKAKSGYVMLPQYIFYFILLNTVGLNSVVRDKRGEFCCTPEHSYTHWAWSLRGTIQCRIHSGLCTLHILERVAHVVGTTLDVNVGVHLQHLTVAHGHAFLILAIWVKWKKRGSRLSKMGFIVDILPSWNTARVVLLLTTKKA